MRSRRTAIAFALSLALHGALVIAVCLWLRARPAIKRSKPPAIRIALLPSHPRPPTKGEPAQREPPSPSPAPPPARRSATAAAPARKPAATAAAPSRKAAAPALPHPPKASRAPDAGLAAAPPAKAAPDAPRSLKLTPDPLPFVASGPTPREEGGGRTIHNVPSELPDPKAVAEQQGREAKERVDGWISDQLATLRVENGLVDPWFSQMRDSLEKGAANPPIQANNHGNDFLKQMARSWLDSAQRYAKTGNPYGSDDPLGNPDARGQGTGADQLQRSFATGGRLQGLGDGRFGAGLRAVVEIRQSGDGKLVSTVLLQSSGNKLFDAHVLRSAPTALTTLPAPPSHAAGVHPDGIRTAWAFEGRVSYRKKLSDVSLAKDGWYLAGMIPLSLLGGTTFDETTGKVEVIDLRHPEFSCKVTLLRVY